MISIMVNIAKMKFICNNGKPLIFSLLKALTELEPFTSCNPGKALLMLTSYYALDTFSKLSSEFPSLFTYNRSLRERK